MNKSRFRIGPSSCCLSHCWIVHLQEPSCSNQSSFVLLGRSRRRWQLWWGRRTSFWRGLVVVAVAVGGIRNQSMTWAIVSWPRSWQSAPCRVEYPKEYARSRSRLLLVWKGVGGTFARFKRMTGFARWHTNDNDGGISMIVRKNEWPTMKEWRLSVSGAFVVYVCGTLRSSWKRSAFRVFEFDRLVARREWIKDERQRKQRGRNEWCLFQ